MNASEDLPNIDSINQINGPLNKILNQNLLIREINLRNTNNTVNYIKTSEFIKTILESSDIQSKCQHQLKTFLYDYGENFIRNIRNPPWCNIKSPENSYQLLRILNGEIDEEFNYIIHRLYTIDDENPLILQYNSLQKCIEQLILIQKQNIEFNKFQYKSIDVKYKLTNDNARAKVNEIIEYFNIARDKLIDEIDTLNLEKMYLVNKSI